jgi:hypothetical protein
MLPLFVVDFTSQYHILRGSESSCFVARIDPVER